MDETTRAALVIALEAQYREAIYASISPKTADRDEQEQIAGAVLAMMLRRMYQIRGAGWLERILRLVLKPAETSAAGPVSSPTTSSEPSPT